MKIIIIIIIKKKIKQVDKKVTKEEFGGSWNEIHGRMFIPTYYNLEFASYRFSQRERERERERERYLLLQLSVTNVPCVFVSKKKKIMGLWWS